MVSCHRAMNVPSFVPEGKWKCEAQGEERDCSRSAVDGYDQHVTAPKRFGIGMTRNADCMSAPLMNVRHCIRSPVGIGAGSLVRIKCLMRQSDGPSVGSRNRFMRPQRCGPACEPVWEGRSAIINLTRFMWRLLQVLFDVNNDGGDGFGIQTPLTERMIRLHVSRFHSINDHGSFGVRMNFYPFRPVSGSADLRTTKYDQGNIAGPVLLSKLRRGNLQPLEIVPEEVDVGAHFPVGVGLNDSADLLDQTGKVVVKRPSEDEDDQTAV